MLVYKFYPPKYASEALKKGRFKVSPIDDLNDPFEYQSINMGDRSVRAWAANFRALVSKENTGIISFSKNWREPLMWAHYAESHKGMALGFEVVDRLLLGVEYISERITPPKDIDNNKESMEQLVTMLIKSKHENWKYEDELRLLRNLDSCDREKGLFFAKWNHTTQLKEVVLGARYQTQEDSVFQEYLESKGVKIITARPKFTGFKMTPQKNLSLQKQL